MLNLEEKIGLKVLLKDDNTLEFDPGIEVEKVSSRKFSDLAPVVADENLPLADDTAYLMCRNVRLPDDEEVLHRNNLRFDLTVIPGAMIGEEFVKTSGHSHPKKQGTDVAYPELYYVASGQATYLMQKVGDGGISDAILCRVKAGEAIVMPPGYGHVTINELAETLVMANWVSNSFESNYGSYEDLRGAGYYLKKSGERAEFVRNEKYSSLPPLKTAASQPELLSNLAGSPIYSYKSDTHQLDFLNNPEKFLSALAVENLFTFQ